MCLSVFVGLGLVGSVQKKTGHFLSALFSFSLFLSFSLSVFFLLLCFAFVFALDRSLFLPVSLPLNNTSKRKKRRGERRSAVSFAVSFYVSLSLSFALLRLKKIKQTKNKKTLRTLHVPPGIPSSANTCVFFLSISAAAAVSDVFALLATSKALSCILWALS